MKYQNCVLAHFVERDNRFVAQARLLDGKEVGQISLNYCLSPLKTD